MHIFYCIFVQFMQFPAIDFGLDHFASQPFINYSTVCLWANLWFVLPYYHFYIFGTTTVQYDLLPEPLELCFLFWCLTLKEGRRQVSDVDRWCIVIMYSKSCMKAYKLFLEVVLTKAMRKQLRKDLGSLETGTSGAILGRSQATNRSI